MFKQIKSDVDDSIDDENFIVFSLADDNIENLGKIIGTKYSREFLKITQNEELNLKEIAKRVDKNENPRLPNSTHHKNRLEKIGLITTRIKMQRRKGHSLKFYKGKKIIIIVPEELMEVAKNSTELKHAIKNIFKFGVVGVAFGLIYILNLENMRQSSNVVTDTMSPYLGMSALVIPLVFLSSFLILDRIIQTIRNKK